MAEITLTQLSSGYVLVRGRGPCNFTQVPHWPANEDTIRQHAFPEASEEFIRAALREAEAPQWRR